jgi:hypothetical protein
MLDGKGRLGRLSADAMRRAFKTFIGVDLGGGKGKTTALCRLRVPDKPSSDVEVIVEDQGAGASFYDEQLIDYLRRFADSAVLAIDAPLSLPVCVRCTLPKCPGPAICEVPTIAWFRQRDAHKLQDELATGGVPEGRSRGKPRYTPYTQRATEVLLHEEHGITPRETLGQGMGPLTARMAFLRRALDEGVRHALIGVDNDGGASRRPEHEDTHRRDEQLLDPNSACSVCWLEQFIPPWWTSEGGQQCLVVPVQTIETWLLILRGHTFASAPESTYHRDVLKKCFFGKPFPPSAERLKLALAEVNKPDALEQLRARSSFARFEQQARAWLFATP